MSKAGATLLSSLIEDTPVHRRSARWFARLWLEGALYTGCGLGLAEVIGFRESGFLALFLAAAGLANRLETVLDENRADIVERQVGRVRANSRSAASLLMLFLGAFFAFGVAALCIGERRIDHAFGFVLSAGAIGQDTILTRTFASVPGLFVHNVLVLFAFVALSLIYSTYGALLALLWNACIWGLVLSFLVQRAIPESSVGAPLFVAVSAVAVLPHLILEAGGYVVGSLAAIYFSKGLIKYAPGEPVFREVMTSVAVLAAVSVGGLLLGAAVEATLPPAVLSHLHR